MKCIFSKDNEDAITDFEKAKVLKGNGYVMDHPYDFYKALCFLQLNEYSKALVLLKSIVEKAQIEKGETWVHPLELFYLGVAFFEMEDYT